MHVHVCVCGDVYVVARVYVCMCVVTCVYVRGAQVLWKRRNPSFTSTARWAVYSVSSPHGKTVVTTALTQGVYKQDKNCFLTPWVYIKTDRHMYFPLSILK